MDGRGHLEGRDQKHMEEITIFRSKSDVEIDWDVNHTKEEEQCTRAGSKTHGDNNPVMQAISIPLKPKKFGQMLLSVV